MYANTTPTDFQSGLDLAITVINLTLLRPLASMGLKRKRSSDCNYSPSPSRTISGSTCASSSPSPNPSQFLAVRPEFSSQMELDFGISKLFSAFDSASGRTRKRCRDRPNEDVIHGRQCSLQAPVALLRFQQSTLSKSYSMHKRSIRMLSLLCHMINH